MSIVISTPAMAINAALKKIGYKLRVGNLYEGSLAAKHALDIYGQTRDALIMGSDWDFVERTTVGTLLKQAPADYVQNPWGPQYPQLPWMFEYSYPGDAIRIRGVKPQAVLVPNPDPRYRRFDVSNDSALSPPQKVVLCNVPNAIIVYAGQITDLTQWDELALETLIDKLGEELGPVLQDLNAARVAAAQAMADKAQADMTEG